MDARQERIRRLRRTAAVWWVCFFVLVLAALVALAAGSDVRTTIARRDIAIHIDQWDDGSWHAAVEPGSASPPDPPGRISYPSGWHIILPENGFEHCNGLGVWSRRSRWDLNRVSIVTFPPNSTIAYAKPEALPADAWRIVIETLEREVFADTVQRDGVSEVMLGEPGFDPLFTYWEERDSGWRTGAFWRELGFNVLIAGVGASIIAALGIAQLAWSQHRLPGCCASCGYDLAGLATTGDQADVTCPECGAASTLGRTI